MTQLTLNFDVAKARGDLGAERAAARAERAMPGWVDMAVEAVRDQVRHARERDGDFTIEQVRAWIGVSIPPPPDARAWGHVTRRAVALWIIEPTGCYAPAASSNGSPKRMYRKGRAA